MDVYEVAFCAQSSTFFSMQESMESFHRRKTIMPKRKSKCSNVVAVVKKQLDLLRIKLDGHRPIGSTVRSLFLWQGGNIEYTIA